MTGRSISFADALTVALVRARDFIIDGMRFQCVAKEATDWVDGRHSLVYELANSGGKTYRVTIAPVRETHR